MNNEELNLLIKKEITKVEKDVLEYQEMTKLIAPDVAIGRLTRRDAINNKCPATKLEPHSRQIKF